MVQMQSSAGILTRSNGTTIAYRRLNGIEPGIVFIHGLRSDMNGAKALALEAHCRSQGRSFLCFDLSGHGASSGRFEDFGIGDWRDDAVEAIDRLTAGPQILVGSSLGGGLMLLAALARPRRAAALMGVAAAPDFTEDLMIRGFDAEQRRQLAEQGRVTVADCTGGEPYVISRTLIEQGRGNLLLRGEIAIDCPIVLIQGQRDADVPWQTAVQLAERLRSPDVAVTLIKSGGHRLSEPGELRILLAALDGLLVRLASGNDS
jgi:pimeloyl-ACP methyl ester carboxylesterase